ncbi:hypothetical protein SPURM210S_01667 [Streptomyces purpurascens]
MAVCSIRLSRGAHWTVKAGPHRDMRWSTGLMTESSAPSRPCASWMVAEEKARSRSTSAASGRSNFVLTRIMTTFQTEGTAEGAADRSAHAVAMRAQASVSTSVDVAKEMRK